MDLLTSSLQDGVTTGIGYTLAFLGVWVMFRLQRDFDVAVDGSFGLGGAVCAILMIHGWNPWPAMLVASLSCSLVAITTFLIMRTLKLILVFVTIVVNLAMYSVLLHVLDLPNRSIVGIRSVYDEWGSVIGRDPSANVTQVSLLALIVLTVGTLLALFLKSEAGLSLRASGMNAGMARANAISPSMMLLVSLIIGDCLSGFGGSLVAQQQGFADVQMGTGTIIFGIAAILLGEIFVRGRGPIAGLVAVLIGTLLYRFVLAFSFRVGISPNDLNAITAIVVIGAIMIDRIARVAASNWPRRAARPRDAADAGDRPLPDEASMGRA